MQLTRDKRNSSIELLRILCMVLILWMHGSSYSTNPLSAWIVIAIRTVGNAGTSCFILISGYYGIRLDVKKMMKLDLMLIFYTWSALVLQYVWGEPVGGEAALSHILPVIGKYSWFFTCYFALSFLSPFLNEMAETLERKRLRALLLTMLVIFSGVTTFLFFDITSDGGKGIVNMVLLYMIGRYLRLYHENTVFEGKKLLGAFLAFALVSFALDGVLYVLLGTGHSQFSRDNTLFTIGETVCLFLLFRGRRFESRLVNQVASTVPAIFIMEWMARGIITRYLFNYSVWYAYDWYELALLGVAVLLVVMGCLIELLRRIVLGRAEDALVPAVYRWLSGAKDKLVERWKEVEEKD